MEYKNEIISQEDQKVVSKFTDEMYAMNNFRNDYENEWKINEKQFDAELESSGVQRASIKLQLTRNIIEQQIGEEGLVLPISVKPEGKNTDSYMIDTAKYLIDHFTRKEEIIDEIVDFKMDRAIYGTGVLMSGIWQTIDVNNFPDGEGDIYNKKFKTVKKEKYHIGIKNISVWDIWFDETADKAKNIKRAIWRERMDIEQFRQTYLGKKGFKYIENVMPQDQDTENPETTNKDIDKQNGDSRNVYLFHYFNEITGDYRIIANRTIPIYVGKNVYKNSKIPFDICQMYKNPKSIYGKSVGYKTRSHEAYMNSLFEILLDKVYLTSNPPLILGNNGETDGEIYSGGGDIATLNFNGDVKQIQQLQLDSRIDAHKFAIDMSKDEIIQNTGINPGEYNKPLSGINPFVAGLQEQSKKAKLLLSQILFDSTLSKSFTKMLQNLITYGPVLYGETIEKIVDGKTLKDVKYYEVQIKGKEVIEKKKKNFTEQISYEENPGNYGYFEFNDTVFKNKDLETVELSVYIETPSTKTLLEAMKKQEFKDYINNLVTMKNLYPADPLPISSQELYEMMSEVYGFDVDEIQLRTETDKIRKEAGDILGLLDQLNPAKIEDTLNSNLPTNATENPGEAMIQNNQAGNPKLLQGQNSGIEQSTATV